MDVGNLFLGIESLVPSVVRALRGTVVRGHRRRPNKLLELYDAEYSPRCRYIRETLTELDLDVVIYPMPWGGERFRSRLAKLGGKGEVPFLHDPNTGKCLDDAQAIADYLYREYGPEGQTVPPVRIATSVLATALRGHRGLLSRGSKVPDQPVELYSFEASPYARIVRETLCEMQIPYILRNVGKGSGEAIEWLPPYFRLRLAEDYVPHTANRRKLQELGGKMQVPFFVDPNTELAMYESEKIQQYLRETYGA